MSTRTLLRTGLGMLVIAGSVTMAQPEQTRRERPVRTPAETSLDPGALRDRIQRSIERGETMLERQREALRRLDAGDSPAEVMRSLRVRDDSILRPRRAETGDGPEPMPPPVDGPGFEPDPMDAPIAGGPEGPRPNRPERVTPEERARLRRLLKERLPSVHEQLDRVEQDHPAIGERLFDRLVPQLRDIARDMERDPRLGELRLDEMRAGLAIVDASRDYWNHDEGERSEPGDRLKEAIGARFDARVALRQYEVERMVARIGELNDQIIESTAGRGEEIERVFQSIVQRPPMLGRGRGTRGDERADEPDAP